MLASQAAFHFDRIAVFKTVPVKPKKSVLIREIRGYESLNLKLPLRNQRNQRLNFFEPKVISVPSLVRHSLGDGDCALGGQKNRNSFIVIYLHNNQK